MPSLIFYMVNAVLVKLIGISKFVVKQFLKNGSEFAYIRRFKTELKESVPNFFKPLVDNNEFENVLTNKRK